MKYFKTKITNITESKTFLDKLQSAYPMLHPEEDMTQIINTKSRARTFTDEQASDLHDRYDEVYSFLDDPCEYILEINDLDI